MKYMMFVSTDATAEPYDAAEDNIVEWVQDVDARGVHLMGERLRPAVGRHVHHAG